MSRVMKALGIAAIVMAVGIYAGAAQADPIGPNNCDSCLGGIYTLEYTVVDSNTVTIKYTADLTNMNANITDIDAIAFKIASSVTAATLDSAPLGWGADINTNETLGAAGCAGGGNGFICSDGNNLLDGSIYTWEFTVDYTGTLFTGLLGPLCTNDVPSCASIKALFSTDNQSTPLLSENITLQNSGNLPLVPAPTTLLLVGSGLVGMWALKRRRQP